MRSSVPDIPRTSEIPFFSSVHGSTRREQRGIERRDLQAAVKHGEREPAHPNPRTGAKRWKYKYANVVFITDETSTKEITSYTQPLDIPEAILSRQQIEDHYEAEERLRRKPSLCTSHTVIVVDHSASMRTPDVTDFENRAKAVFGMLAVDFVAKQRLSGAATDTDVVSLVLMDDWVEVVFEREPMGLVLYNKLVGLHHRVRPRSHGNFLPSLDQAQKLFCEDHDGSALCLLFLSDGRPSDNCTGVVRGSYHVAAEAISERMSGLATAFRERLAVATLGFGRPSQDFSVLEAMAMVAREAGANAEFHRPELSSVGLGSAIAATISSLSATKSRLTTVLPPLSRVNSRPRPALRQVEKECVGSSDSWRHAPTTSETGDGWVIYTDDVKRYEYRPLSVRGLEAHPWVVRGLFSSRADGIVIRRKAFGEGAERLVFAMQEYDSRRGEMVGPELVAKESKQAGLDEQKSSFHNIFASTQATAMKVAARFNMLVGERLTLYDDSNELVDRRVWDVTFLSCSVYSFFEAGVERFVLAEKRLEPASAYRKWNGNNGYVFHGQGQISANAVNDSDDGELHTPVTMKTVLADDGDSFFDSDGDGVGSIFSKDSRLGYGVDVGAKRKGRRRAAPDRVRKRDRDEMLLIFRPRPDDYLQAFSHFSYWNSGRRMLVCDLQGVMTRNPSNDDISAGVFELTDPVIHYCSKTGRKQVYGRTDLGKKGVRRFFETHDCNDVCRLLGLPGSWSPGRHVKLDAGDVTTAVGAEKMPMLPPEPSPKRRKFEWMP